jgi:hypothetical protein
MAQKISVVVAAFTAVAVVVALPSAASAAIRIHKIRYDPPGADYRNNRQLNAEYIVVKNTGTSAKQLRGWVIRDRYGWRYAFPSYRLGPGGYVRSTLVKGEIEGVTSIGAGGTSSGTIPETRPG